jgi:hypothetical protein
MKVSTRTSFMTRRVAPKFTTVSILLLLATVGCSSGSKPVTVVPNPSLPTGLPTPAAPGPVNTYSGGQSPGVWTLTLDNTKNAFSYQPVTYPPTPDQPTSGSILPQGGFSNLGAGGLAYEVPGRAAVLRPGTSAASRVFTVPQTTCYAITGKLRFQYIALFPGTLSAGSPDLSPNTAPVLGYGSIVASTDSTGKTWQFENLQGNVVAGPASFAGACAASNSQASIVPSGQTVLDFFWPPPNNLVQGLTTAAVSNIWVGPSGFFAADQSDPTQASLAGASIAGMAEPSAPLSTTAVAAAQYLGFLYEARVSSSTGYTAVNAFTAPIGFGQVVSSTGNTMTGGIFPADDVTGPPNSDTLINLGSQDATYNGLYMSVSITVLDPAQNCANFPGSPTGFAVIGVTSGISAQGYITCTFPGVAVAGNPDGHYAIFINTYNWAANLGGAPMEIFLFGQ